ncbi:Aldehyde dehydrogenase protein [Pseudomonas coronafaciens pv. garcae]|uniref:2,5-dioxovalerate dehydrogenase n=2 Tax=Pseudomonas syringae group TaxID=136849 RepID=A0AB37QR54_9PSED|nr:Aldehyde dehydrogenase [Pseudomonas coronafaciens pv. garcae]KPY03044.1 Aldehyde dehydrogenase family protein [Pseudomonas coronafaciens pv. oryzae]RMN89202.1 Aldehyde dehydrogenase protein [Pseudomonas coronafaciens pv. coronafaciens]RMR99804.1 Aldehyde dehydrogenase [Pseudomonas coronafaciens pv. garcae]RMS03812.1 Aldehyde dehydrogenase protein [Pseudomonas coronafaciens pv. garcae]
MEHDCGRLHRCRNTVTRKATRQPIRSARSGTFVPASNIKQQEIPMPNILGQNFIAGGRSALGQSLQKSLDATTGEELPYSFHQATDGEIDAAALAAKAAFPEFRQLSPARRAEFLDAIADELDQLGDDFVAIVCQETALPQARIQGERGRTSGQMRLFAKVLRRGDFVGARIDLALPDRKPLPRVDLRQYRIGVGPVAVFGASNFPLAFSTAGGDTAAALAAGCPVVFKAHSGHMATADLVASAIIRAAERTKMPKGVFNMIFGNGVGEGLVKHPAIQAVGFTGSLNGGNALCKMAAERPQPIPVFAEMSSINPVVILPGALQARSETVAKELAGSVVMGAGQFCTNPGVVIGLRSPAFTTFVEQLTEQMGSQAPQTMLNAGGLRSYSKGVEHLLSHAGVTHLAGKPQEGKQAQAQLFKADVSLLLNGDQLLQEEVFGPTTLIIEVADDAQLKDALQALRGQLTATVIGEPADLSQYNWLQPILEEKVGRILFNGYPTGVEVCEAMVHGGPYPATSDARGTSVGTLAIDRFLRPVCYQNLADSQLPPALQNANPLGLRRLVNGEWSDQPVV